MEFRLLYDGLVRATQGDPKPGERSRHFQLKHDMRKRFSAQLARLWQETPMLVANQTMPDPKWFHIENLATAFRIPPWSFVPLVTSRGSLLCGLDVLFLRTDAPGKGPWGGDIDNRIKTVIDALRMPTCGDGYADFVPDEGSDGRLFCLLEDDALLSRLSVETDKLLDAPAGADPATARLVITVHIKPERLTYGNIGF